MTEAKVLDLPSEAPVPRLDQLLLLLDVCRFMGHENNLDRLLIYIAEQGRRALQADRCSIFLLDESLGEIWSKVQLGEDKIIRFPRGSGVAGRCIDSGQAVMISDAYNSKSFNAEIDKATGYRTRNILCVPMANLDGKTIGCLQLLNKLEGMFDAADEAFCLAFAAQAAVAIESAYLHLEKARIIGNLSDTQVRLNQKVEQLEIVRELEGFVNESATVYDFVSAVLRRAVRSVGAEVGRLMIRTEGRAWETYAARVDERSKVLHLSEQRLASPYLNKLLREGEATIVNKMKTIRQLHAQLAQDLEVNLENVLSIPIRQTGERGGDGAQGIFEVFNKPGGFAAEDLAFLQIITAQIFSLIMRRQLIEEKERTKSLAAIGQLASTIIHDLKNPISAIIGCSELLASRDSLINQQQIERLSTIICNQANRCITMVEELLSVARGEKRFRFEIVALNEVLKEIEMMLETETQRRKVELVTHFAYEGMVRIDRAKLMRVIFNLTNNALEILKEGGIMRIETRALDKVWVEISITDNGPGVPSDVAKQLFKPFATFGKAKGTGLGLYIAREIIRDHGGVIDLDASYSGGARFRIKLKQEH